MLIILVAIYFYLYVYKKSQEGFIPRLNLLVRPHLRNVRLASEIFTNNYGLDVIIQKLKKMNIY